MSDLPPEDHPLAQRTLTPFQSRMTMANPTLFNNDEVRAYYLELFGLLCDELETIPGYNTAMMLLAEQLAFLHAQQRADAMAESPAHAVENQQLVLRLTQVFDRLLKARDERSADEAFKRQFMGATISAVADAIEQACPTPELATQIQAHLVALMRRDSTAIGTTARP